MNLKRVAFAVALLATLGSLYFSEVLGYPPCVLCWYQRIAMYPLVVIFGVALWNDDRQSQKYSAPLVAIGLAVSIYHNLLYYGVIPDSITPCTQGVSCTSKQVEYWGFITIPLLALTSFVTLALLELSVRMKKEMTHE